MLKRIWIVAVLFLLGVVLLYLLKIPFTLIAHETNQEPTISKEESIVNKVAKKLHKRYVGVDVKTTTNKELVLQIVGDEAYFNSVKKDMESLVRNEIKSTVLEDYPIVFNRYIMIGDSDGKYDVELHLLLQTLVNGLKDYQEIKQIGSGTKQSLITIHTSILGTDKHAQKVAKEIEQKAKNLLNSNELQSLPRHASFRIKIVNSEGLEIIS